MRDGIYWVDLYSMGRPSDKVEIKGSKARFLAHMFTDGRVEACDWNGQGGQWFDYEKRYTFSKCYPQTV